MACMSTPSVAVPGSGSAITDLSYVGVTNKAAPLYLKFELRRPEQREHPIRLLFTVLRPSFREPLNSAGIVPAHHKISLCSQSELEHFMLVRGSVDWRRQHESLQNLRKYSQPVLKKSSKLSLSIVMYDVRLAKHSCQPFSRLWYSLKYHLWLKIYLIYSGMYSITTYDALGSLNPLKVYAKNMPK